MDEKNYYQYSPEFALAFFDKVSFISNYSLGAISGKDNTNNLLFYLPVVMKNDNIYFNIKGSRTFGPFTHDAFLKSYPNLANLELKSLTKEQFDLTFNQINYKKLNDAKNLLADFHNLELIKEVKDKFNNEYEITIVSNEDTSIGDNLIVDKLFLKDKQTQKNIGYLQVKYNTSEILDKLHGEKDQFTNVATIDYSRLVEEYQHKGLGYVMYFYMSQYLNQKNISFRESTTQSPPAIQLWNGIRRHMNDYLQFKTINNKNNVAFLSIAKNFTLNFVDTKPIIKKF